MVQRARLFQERLLVVGHIYVCSDAAAGTAAPIDV